MQIINLERQQIMKATQKFFVFIFSIVNFQLAISQVQNNGVIYIGDNGVFHLDSGTFFLGNLPATSTTTRTEIFHGVFSFGATALANNASETHFIDGYVKTATTAPFVFPIGQLGVYAPAKVIPSTNLGVEAAYYKQNPSTIGTTLDASVIALSTNEYWDISGVNAIVSLSWRSSSNLAAIAPSVDDIIISGYHNALSKWVEIPSTIDTPSFFSGNNSTLDTGSITSVSSVNLSDYSAFTLASKTSLRNKDFDLNQVSAYINNQVFYIKASTGILGVDFFDIAGRKIGSYRTNGVLDFNAPFIHAEGIYMTKITLDNGSTVNYKLINKN